MSEDTNTKRPPFRVMTVIGNEDETKKDFWLRIGAAWPNQKGGMNLQLHSLPLDGRLVILPNDDEPDSPAPTAEPETKGKRK